MEIHSYRPDLSAARAATAGFDPIERAGLLVRASEVDERTWRDLANMSQKKETVMTTANVDGTEVTLMVRPVLSLQEGKQVIRLMPATLAEAGKVFSEPDNRQRGKVFRGF